MSFSTRENGKQSSIGSGIGFSLKRSAIGCQKGIISEKILNYHFSSLKNLEFLSKSKMHTQHETVKLDCPFNKNPIDIDKGIAPLVTEIWKAGIKTTSCCEADVEHKDMAYLQFLSGDYEKFMSIVADFHDYSDEEMKLYEIILNEK